MTPDQIFSTIGLTRDQVALAITNPGHTIRTPREPKQRPQCPVCSNAISTKGCALTRTKPKGVMFDFDRTGALKQVGA